MYKLAIDDVVEVPVKFTLKAGKVNKTFAFTLTAKRLEQDAITAKLEECQFKYKDFLQSDDLISDWKDQRLVLTADDQPADFNPDSFAVMLSTQGVAKVCFEAYQKECSAKEKN